MKHYTNIALLVFLPVMVFSQTQYRLGFGGGIGISAAKVYKEQVAATADFDNSVYSANFHLDTWIYPFNGKTWFFKTGVIGFRQGYSYVYAPTIPGFVAQESFAKWKYHMGSFAVPISFGKSILLGQAKKSFVDVHAGIQLGATLYSAGFWEYAFRPNGEGDLVGVTMLDKFGPEGDALKFATNLEAGAAIAPFSRFTNLQFTILGTFSLVKTQTVSSSAFFGNATQNIIEPIDTKTNARFITLQAGLQFSFGNFHKRLKHRPIPTQVNFD